MPLRKVPLHEQLTRTESEVLSDALTTYIRILDRRAAHGDPVTRDEAAWRQYLALELKQEVTQP